MTTNVGTQRIVILAAVLSGCADAGPSLMERLNSARPIQPDLFTLQKVKVLGEPQPAQGPLTVKPGERLTIQGELRRGEWGTSGVMPFWIPDDPSQSFTQTTPQRKPADPPLLFALWLYGESDPPSVVHYEMIQVQHQLDPGDIVFRVQIPVPETEGEYIADLIMQKTEGQRRRGFSENPESAIPIMRIPILIED